MKEYDLNPSLAVSGWQSCCLHRSIFMVLGLVCPFMVACNNDTPPTVVEHPLIGKPFPALDVTPLANSSDALTLGDTAEQVVLINFWGPWCVPCRIEMPHIIELEKRLRDREDFRFVSISCASHPNYQLREETERYVAAQEIEFAVYSDAEGKTRWPLIDAMGSNGEFQYPTTVLLDRNSNVAGYWAGYEPGLEKEVAAAVGQALGDE